MPIDMDKISYTAQIKQYTTQATLRGKQVNSSDKVHCKREKKGEEMHLTHQLTFGE